MGRRSFLFLLLALVLIGAGLALMPILLRLEALAADMVPGGQPIFVTSANVPLKPDDRQVTQVGKLRYLGGLYITSTDRRFGGFSGLIVSPDGQRLLAISDRSYWLTARLVYSGGRLAGLSQAFLAPILDATGKPLKSPYHDSESIVSERGGFPLDDPTGVVDIGFETRDRVARFGIGRDGFAAKAAPLPMPQDIENNKLNKGFEAIARLADGRLLAITERTLEGAGNIKGWIVGPGGAGAPLSLKRDAPYDLSDMAFGPDGNLYLLERRFSRAGGAGMRIRRILVDTIKPGWVLDGEVLADLDQDYSIDNMEGLAMRRAEDGRTLLYIVSDDNYSAAERTLLLMFELRP